MRSLFRGEPDVVIRWAGPFILGGMVLGFVAGRFNIPGTISAVFAIGLGASGGSLAEFRMNRGLWMLAGTFLLIDCGVYGLMTFGNVVDIVRGAPRGGVGLVIDFGIGTSLLSSTVRFLWKVAQYNWIFSRNE